MALRERNLAAQVVGVGRRETSLAEARAVGAVDATTTDLVEGVRAASLVVVCTPVARIAHDVLQAAAAATPDTLITDAGSVKQSIVEQVAAGAHGKRIHFVGSHPLAGSEKSGPRHATADLFCDRLVILTPTDQSLAADVQQIEALWRAVGAQVRLMPPNEHDRILAATSHVPHLLASALACGIPAPWWELSAGGLRDTTRIAAGDPELWQQILLANRTAILEHLTRLERDLGEMRSALEAADVARLTALLASGKERRDALGN